MSDTFRDADASQASRKLGDSTIGEDLKITGNVTSKGEIHLDGEVNGDVLASPWCSARAASSKAT